jgi:glycosyltransferase involved in cell wall biosynthesis
MKISIITAVRNGERTIARAIESIRAQKDVEIEHIVIEGLSSDSTLEILKQYESRFSVIISEADIGIYDAINKGIKLATGDIIGILNSDDYYSSDKTLSTVVNTFKKMPVDAVYGDLEYFNGDDISRVVRTYNSKYFNAKKLDIGLMPAHPALFLKKQVYEKYGLYNIGYRIAGDFEFIARIFKDESLSSIHLPTIMVRMQLGGVSTQGITSAILINREIIRACQENGIKTNYLKLLSRYPRKLLEYFIT